MNDETVIRDYVRTRTDADKTVVELQVISWDGPYTPVGRWVKVTELPADAAPTEVDKAIAKVLADRKYFRVCKDCGKKNLVGHMLEDDICHHCAETKHGVVF